ncbi:alkaline phosphatase [Paracoccus sp. DMF-8]|uniref:alkaline phosphatase n=1 Tax=Paracoccus sp. DMF-8 TaxID=3019445 RepID=UPI0023E3C1E8|nr:alkaline phosphatase [Paracoccus sp. DMF-8]MDF3607606.1 alkaline phosphatase [Paracoccus sp. DMF-8]
MVYEDLLPYTAMSKTYTHDAQVADSAPTATAMVSGVKPVNGTIGVTQAIKVGDCASQQGAEVTTIFERAEGGWSGDRHRVDRAHHPCDPRRDLCQGRGP